MFTFTEKRKYLREMKKWFLIIPMLIHNFGYAQKDSARSPKWFISFVVSPQRCYRTIHQMPAIDYNSDHEEIPYINNHSARTAVCGSLLLSYKPKHWLSIQTGMIFDNQGYKTAFSSDTINGNSHFIPTVTTSDAYKATMKYLYFGVPLKIMTEIKVDKNTYFISDLGFNFFKIRGAHAKIEHLPATSTYSNHVNNSDAIAKDYSINVGIGFMSHFKKASLIIKPNYTYFPTHLTCYAYHERTYYKMNLYSFGLEIGMIWSLEDSHTGPREKSWQEKKGWL
jgi:hypothetical protein